MESKFLTLNWQDIGKGIIVAILTAVITYLYDLVSKGANILDVAVLAQMGSIALAAGLGYILKNLLTNNVGQFGRRDA